MCVDKSCVSKSCVVKCHPWQVVSEVKVDKLCVDKL